ncbi:MAG: TolC family protein [Sphingobacteriales bacterium]|nr:MAG: TolC family protein [Sphingobacteriales bacterium]
MLLLVNACWQSRAQNLIQPDSTLKWDLKTCLEYARKNNIQVNTLRYEQSLSEQDLLGAKARQMPTLNGSLSQSFTNSKNANPVVGGFQTQASFAGNYALNTGWTIYNGGFLRKDVQQQGLLIQSANLSVKEAENDITLQITQAFLNILLARENIVYLEDVLNTSRAQYKQAEQRYEAGALSKKDLLQLQSQVANDQYTLVNAQTNYRQNTVNLKQLLQIPSTRNFEARQPDTVFAKEAIPSLEEASKAAMETRPEIKNSQLNIDIAAIELEKQRALGRPSVSLGGNLSSGFSDNQTTKFFPQIDNNFFQRLGVTVGIPIFNNRSVKTNVERTKIIIEQAKLTLLGTKTTLDQAVEQAYIAVLNAQAQYDAAEVQLKANDETYRITSGQLELGAVNALDLQLQKNLYVQAVQAFVQAKYNAVLSIKVYNFYTGVPVTLD